MKTVVIAIDSFKGSISSKIASETLRLGILTHFPNLNVVIIPVSDGGEGLIEALENKKSFRHVSLIVSNPVGKPIKADYLLSADNKTAIMEMATAAGLTLIEESDRNPMKTTTFGVGEMICDALKRGCRHILLGIGGSATNDGGVGMLQALGFNFYDASGKEIEPGGGSLIQINRISDEKIDPAVKECRFEIACDVNNPLYGKNGAAFVYAPQKGADSEMVGLLDAGLHNFSNQIIRFNNKEVSNIPGAGAAGGLGAGLLAFLNARIESGIELILKHLHFDENLKKAALVITGEGKMDQQTLMGKVPYGVLKEARKHGIPVIGIAGRINNKEILLSAGFSQLYEISPRSEPLEKVMLTENTLKNIIRITNHPDFISFLKHLIESSE